MNQLLYKEETDNIAVSIVGVEKKFRIYHERHQTLKETVLARKRTSYDVLWALKDVSYDFERGRTYGIIGENGSGKSTLLKIIARILRPDKGDVVINGRVSALLELGAGFHPDLTGRENIYLNGAILRLPKKEIDARFDEIVEFSELEYFIDVPVKNYSSGMYMRLGFAIAVNVDPDILLIDEVLAVGDESFQKKCLAKLESIKESGKTIVFVSHDTGSVEKLCDSALLIDQGKMISSGKVGAVVDKYHALLSSREREIAKKQSQLGKQKPKTNRYGTFEGRITGVEVLSDSGRKKGVFNSGEEGVIRIKNSFKKDVSDPIFGIIINNPEGVQVYTTNTRWRGMKFESFSKGDQIDIDYRLKMNLCGGEYSITPAIAHTDGSRFYDWLENAGSFKVKDSKKSSGIAEMESEIGFSRKKAKKEDK